MLPKKGAGSCGVCRKTAKHEGFGLGRRRAGVLVMGEDQDQDLQRDGQHYLWNGRRPPIPCALAPNRPPAPRRPPDCAPPPTSFELDRAKQTLSFLDWADDSLLPPPLRPLPPPPPPAEAQPSGIQMQLDGSA